MKLFLALIQSAILALIAWLYFDSAVQKYQALTSIDANTLTQRYLAETEHKDGKDQPKYKTPEEAATQAAKDIATGKRLLAAGSIKIGGSRLALAVGSAIAGFVGWFIAFFIVYITTKPLTTVLNSIWGNFTRYFLGPLVPVTIIGAIVVVVAAEAMIQSL